MAKRIKSLKMPENGHPHRTHQNYKKWSRHGQWDPKRKSDSQKIKLTLEELKIKEAQEIDEQAQEED
jgi:hypothetical protein